jgi:hypothetical protein
MKSYSLIVKRNFIADGREYSVGEVVGSIASHLDFGTLMSVAGPADRVVAIDDDEVDADDVPSDIDPAADADSGDAADDDDQTEVDDDSAEPAAAAAAPPAVAGPDDDSLLTAGIPERAAEVLRDNGLDNLEAVLQWLTEGNDLIDLDGIGPKLKKDTLTALGL